MRILIVGGGAREHAIAWKLTRERAVTDICCLPGNPGIATTARVVAGDPSSPADVLAAAERERVDLTVVGPEAPLSRGVVDRFLADGRAIVGPTRQAAALEWSKAFAKDFMARRHIPTARFHICESADDALATIAGGELGLPLVVKADGLAAGKGVVIAPDRAEAEATIRDVMVGRRFGAAGERVVLEECLVGEEASYFVLADGEHAVTLGSAQDHKRIFDDDRGPNTGGMGAYAPSPHLPPDLEARVLDEIVRPVLTGMAEDGHPYRGFLYVGLMLTADGPKVIEFNVRFGDPEAQVVFPRLDEDLSWLLAAAGTGVLPSRPARFRNEPHVGVVLASAGYPGDPRLGDVISGVEAAAAEPGALVFHAGTSRRGDGKLVTAGGRVLTVVGRGRSYQDAIDVAYRASAHVTFDGAQRRSDIGRRAVAAARA
uniref:Phosphoribosylamine--glycine ligase n=1 Tax=uncultured Acidobacteriota bacterium TaxID=171953 RepID=Q7X2W7_9BACT|nr:putative glycinamidribonucleotide synthetase [uncultured Acidobacteriota bacterium]